ncbi:MAG: RagB/SusD family nutrient uptake outer membrane protein [Muribaculaceae bacterium]|nr:RagB/SusD family nutrient uptake outer membrane protein [Muribaculaceae bacterium]
MNKAYISKAVKSILLALALSGGALMTLTSCEDTLEKPSFTADDIDYVFSDIQKSDIYVKGVYRYFCLEEMFRAANTGDGVTTANEDNFTQANMQRASYNYDPYRPWVFGDVYRQSYNAIESCNLGIKRIGLLEESPERNALLAELYMLRAYSYHNLIRFLGDVPTQWEAMEDCDIKSTDVLYPTRQPRDVIYDRIIKDMQDHVNDLPWQSENPYVTNERLTRNAGLGIMARICLHAAGYSLRWDLETNDEASLHMGRRDDAARVREIYEIADAALAEVINKGENHLIQDTPEESGFMNLFRNFTGGNYGPTAPEMMWMIAQQGEKTNSRLGNYVGVTGAGSGSFFAAMKALQIKLPTFYLSYDPRDTRRDVTAPMYTIGHSSEQDIHCGTTYSSVMGGKYRVQWAQAPYNGSNRNIDMAMLRYSDVLLMYAETQNFLNGGPTEAAKNALKQVRERASVGDLPIPTKEDEFLEAVMHERQWELADEFVLRTDLVRTNLLDKFVTEIKQDLRDLADKTGKYANAVEYRIYNTSVNEGVYGDQFLMVDYIDVTDPSEIAAIATMPRANQAAKVKEIRAAVQKIVEARGHKYNNDWYPVKLFEAITSDYNNRSRQICGTVVVSTWGLGSTITQKATGTVENGGKYPEWIDGENGLFFGYKKNHSELSPFAGDKTGHPLVDNPRLTQLPGYPGAKTEF